MIQKNTTTNEIFQGESLQPDCIDIANTSEAADFFLNQAKNKKIGELNAFHASQSVKTLTIQAGELQTHISLFSSDRYLIDEQITLLMRRIDLGEINPVWVYKNTISLPVNLEQLKSIQLYIGELVDDNFNVRRNHEAAIKALASTDAIDAYDFTSGYRLNQVYNFSS